MLLKCCDTYGICQAFFNLLFFVIFSYSKWIFTTILNFILLIVYFFS